MQNHTFFHFDLAVSWQEKIRHIHASPWHGQLEEAGTGSWVQSLLQTQAGASATLDASHTRYAYEAQSQAYPNVPKSRSLSAERVNYWASYLQYHEPTGRECCFALAMSGGLKTLNEPPQRDHHAWISLCFQQQQHTLHVRLKAQDRLEQQMALGLLGIELLYLLTQQTLSPEHMTPELQSLLEIDVWRVKDESLNDHLHRHITLLQTGWTSLIVFSSGHARRYLSTLRYEHLQVEKGSFNPMTLAHQQALKLAGELQPGAVPVFELSLHNADKGHAETTDLLHRLNILAMQPALVVLTQTPTLLATRELLRVKAKARQVDFVCGTDLYLRVFMEKYYPDGIETALKQLFAYRTHLYVVQRPQSSYGNASLKGSQRLQLQYDTQIHPIPSALNISSSAVRLACEQEQEHWQNWVTPEVATYMLQHRLYGLSTPERIS